MRRPGTADDYVEMVRQAIYEVEELRACIDYDNESLSHLAPFVNDLERHINKVYDDMKQGTYTFQPNADLPFMEIVNRWGDAIPFYQLLTVINQTHREGLDVEE